MADNILDELGLDQETYDSGEASAVAKAFEPLTSGAYDGVVKEIIIYTNKWDGKQARYTVTVDKNGEPTDLTFRSDIGKELKDGKPNKGYAGRLKQFAHATGTELASLTMGKDTKIKSFGTEYDGEFLIGMNGKKVKVLVRQSDDTNKAEGAPFKITNDVMGVVAMDGTDAEGENAVEAFAETCKKTPIFAAAKKQAGGNKATTAAKTADGGNVDDML